MTFKYYLYSSYVLSVTLKSLKYKTTLIPKVQLKTNNKNLELNS